ncbi:hypothetical protein [Arsenophonus nasoniae]|uniref:Uncharacterized protein n=1 Tax=Arsenophonus nasoniae TaxID=638 RepID=A0AA95GD09_9GAMM|nr:hypothetical protein [Arsenophonus nasoniae]WGL95977.1 hypothetical protein QE207_05165 [Arsenophonus nasoniae]
MELKIRKGFRKVNYFSIILYIPPQFNYITTDDYGEIWIYKDIPIQNNRCDIWSSSSGTGAELIDLEVDLNGIDWRTTLRTVDDCEVK